MRLAFLVLVACGSPTATVPTAPLASTSNVLRSDYAGSSACSDCHAQVYATWVSRRCAT